MSNCRQAASPWTGHVLAAIVSDASKTVGSFKEVPGRLFFRFRVLRANGKTATAAVSASVCLPKKPKKKMRVDDKKNGMKRNRKKKEGSLVALL